MFEDRNENPFTEQEVKDEKRRKFWKRLLVSVIVFVICAIVYGYVEGPSIVERFKGNQQTEVQTSVTNFVELSDIPTETLESEIDRLYSLAYDQARYGTQAGNCLSSAASGLANTYQLEIMRRALGIEESGK